DEAGVSLWLTIWKSDAGGAWSGRRVMALVGGAVAGRLDVYVHPDGQAVQVEQLEVEPAYRRRGLASVLMDALYEAYPTAWINHGGRGPQGTLWWDRYSEPAPQRNVHNRPPAAWARYFDPVAVAGQRARNAYQNRYQGVDGNQEAVYRYGEPMEAEARQYAPLFREPDAQGPDPQLDELYGGMRLFLPPGLHRVVHDASADAVVRAGIVLDHIGYGNLPHDSAWSTTEPEAFEDLAHEEVFHTAERRPLTHVTFRILPLAEEEPPLHDVKASWVRFVNSPGIEVQVAGMSWRSPHRPWVTPSAVFDPPLDAAIAPEFQRDASAAYRARYSELGELHPGQRTQRGQAPSPYVGRGAEISAMANRLLEGIAQRAAARPAAASAQPSPAEQQAHQQESRQQAPRIR
ncbi:GNAT family N-acetyltransferase, partial [Streptomyces sp. NPDC059468]|uniref:GNAT family N-acetyltransferase n=1 Tax=Streptomyces sp. NPDC059468 TaxID=3346845 RepID=UPI0036B91CD7